MPKKLLIIVEVATYLTSIRSSFETFHRHSFYLMYIYIYIIKNFSYACLKYFVSLFVWLFFPLPFFKLGKSFWLIVTIMKSRSISLLPWLLLRCVTITLLISLTASQDNRKANTSIHQLLFNNNS